MCTECEVQTTSLPLPIRGPHTIENPQPRPEPKGLHAFRRRHQLLGNRDMLWTKAFALTALHAPVRGVVLARRVCAGARDVLRKSRDKTIGVARVV
jgi:hypothetical protein